MTPYAADYNRAMLIRANLLLALAGAGALLAGCGPSREESLAAHGATVARYCTDCHDDAERTAELSLESLPLTAVAAHPSEWEKVVRKLRAGMMPPVDEPRPTAEARL